MTFQRPAHARPGHLATALAMALALQGCASSPSAPRPAPTSAGSAAPARQAPEPIIEMAPIPNPTEPVHAERAARARHERRLRSREDEAAASGRTASRPEPSSDHARAAHLRAEGLEQLDRGQINRAVQLLQAASQLDPDNALIHHDLERALRISKAVESRH